MNMNIRGANVHFEKVIMMSGLDFWGINTYNRVKDHPKYQA